MEPAENTHTFIVKLTVTFTLARLGRKHPGKNTSPAREYTGLLFIRNVNIFSGFTIKLNSHATWIVQTLINLYFHPDTLSFA